MSIEELTAIRNARLAPFGRAAALLQPPPEIIEKLPLAIYACDADRRVLWFNDRATQLWGREPRIGDDIEKYCASYKLYFDGRPIARHETPIAFVLRTGGSLREAQGLVERPDGSTIWALVHIEPIRENGIVLGAISCVHDVTDRVRAEELLRQRGRWLATTYELAGVGIAEVNADGKLARVNAHLAALLGYGEEELLGRSIFDPALTETAGADQAQFRRQVSGEIGRYTIEKRFLRRDGGKLWASVTSSSVRDGDGRFLYAVRVQEDITARKVVEASLARRAEEQTALRLFISLPRRCSIPAKQMTSVRMLWRQFSALCAASARPSCCSMLSG